MGFMEWVNLVGLSVILGLFGFVEPCTVGSSLLFVKSIESVGWRRKVAQTAVFMLARGGFVGSLGVAAALLGTVFIGFQKAGWMVLGGVYLAMGLLYALGKAEWMKRAIGPKLARFGLIGHKGVAGSATLGVLFGLNIPACAAPLVFALLGQTAVAAKGDALVGFVTLAAFGIALSLPLFAIVLVPPLARALDRLAALSVRVPRFTGVVFAALGLWSLAFAFFVDLENWK